MRKTRARARRATPACGTRPVRARHATWARPGDRRNGSRARGRRARLLAHQPGRARGTRLVQVGAPPATRAGEKAPPRRRISQQPSLPLFLFFTGAALRRRWETRSPRWFPPPETRAVEDNRTDRTPVRPTPRHGTTTATTAATRQRPRPRARQPPRQRRPTGRHYHDGSSGQRSTAGNGAAAAAGHDETTAASRQPPAGRRARPRARFRTAHKTLPARTRPSKPETTPTQVLGAAAGDEVVGA